MAESYNATGSVRTLLGNWQEEQELKQVTSTSCCKLTNAGAAGGCVASHTCTVHEPTYSRVIQHTEKESPQDWTPHSAEAFQPPAQRQAALSYVRQPASGPREAQELEQLRAQAAVALQPAEAEGQSWSTTYAAEHQAKSMEGLQLGRKVMRQDGAPVKRDPVFLQESGIVPNAARLLGHASVAGQGLKKVPSLGYVQPPSGSAGASGLTSSSIDPAVPYTMYSEAAAKATYTGNFYGTATLGKGLINRNDQFTKLMGDVKKLQKLL